MIKCGNCGEEFEDTKQVHCNKCYKKLKKYYYINNKKFDMNDYFERKHFFAYALEVLRIT